MTKAAAKLYQQIAADIQAAIADGRYRPGMRLPGERDLAETFAVSRPTIREAMIALEIRGLVESRHGSGIYVTSAPDTAAKPAELDVGAFELNEARILFEGESAALAATAIDGSGLADLDAAVASMADASDPQAALAADKAFHLRIAEATGNGVVRTVVQMLWDIREHSPLCVHMFAQAQHEGVTPRAAEHRLIVDALRAGDPAAARSAMRAHLRRVTDDMLAATELELITKAREEAHAHRSRIARRTSV